MFTPAEVAVNVIGIGKSKASTPSFKLFLLGIMAGMFIALAAVGANTVTGFFTNAGAAKIVAASVFPAGLAMVLVAGSELFTGNCLIIVSVLEKEVRISQMLRNWVFVYVGNFVGAVIIALIIYGSGHFGLNSGGVAVTTVTVAAAKCSLTFGRAVLLGLLCNLLVCVAVWMSFAAKTVSGKIIGLFFPVMMFVLCGFEHSVANMYYIPAGLFAAESAEFAAAYGGTIANLGNLTWGNFFLNNLIPVTVGNILGGGLFVGVMYWSIYLKGRNGK